MKALPIRTLLLLIVVIVLGWGVGSVIQRVTPIGTDVGARLATQVLLADGTVPTLTPDTATLTLVVFTDYQCPACRKADPALAEALARDGHVRVRFRDYPIFGERSERAARIAIAAAPQGIYAALHHRLMAERRPLDEAVLRDAVEASGGDWRRLLRDLKDKAPQIEAQLAATRRHAAGIGVAGTPSYLAGTILVVGAMDTAGFERLFARGREQGPESMPFE